MIYLVSFKLSERRLNNPNIYPYNVFRDKEYSPFIFGPITIFYGSNGAGKSTLLNVIANTLKIRGYEHAISNKFGIVDYCKQYENECCFSFGEDEEGQSIAEIPKESRYIKSEDILYEIKKIQQQKVLSSGMLCEFIEKGMSYTEANQFLRSQKGNQQQENIKFSQEKYSNGETAMKYYLENLKPDALYLLDEPEVSLSPANQVKLAEEINVLARFLNCQFIIATHSPFMLGTLHAQIYNLDKTEGNVIKWTDLENVRYFYEFFKKKEAEFFEIENK